MFSETITMKYLKYSISTLAFAFLIFRCESEKRSIITETQVEQTRILRLTYDIAFFSDQDIQILNSKRIFQNGRTFEVQIRDKMLRLSAIWEENLPEFPFWCQKDPHPESLFSFPMQPKGQAKVQIINCNQEIYFVWTYKSAPFLIIVEQPVQEANRSDLEIEARNFHEFIKKGMKIY